MESFARLTDGLFSIGGAKNLSLAINSMMISTTVDWNEAGLILNIFTNLANGGHSVNITFSSSSNKGINNKDGVKKPEPAEIIVLVPKWAKASSVNVLKVEKGNGRNSGYQKVLSPGKYAYFGPQLWTNKTFQFTISVGLNLEPLNDNRLKYAKHFAIMYGPIVLATLVDGYNQNVQLCADSSISPEHWLQHVPNTNNSIRFNATARVMMSTNKEAPSSFKSTIFVEERVVVELIPLRDVIDQYYVVYNLISPCS